MASTDNRAFQGDRNIVSNSAAAARHLPNYQLKRGATGGSSASALHDRLNTAGLASSGTRALDATGL